MRSAVTFAAIAVALLTVWSPGVVAGPGAARPNVAFPFAIGGAASGPTTTNNDDGCDIGLTPAATLLLPYFEVDCNSPQGKAQTTLFTVINTSSLPAFVKVTLWTDWAFPVLDFNIFLTGYDVQAINLYDVLQRGVIARTAGIGGARGAISEGYTSNPNFGDKAAFNCLDLPGAIPPGLLADVRASLTTGLNIFCGGLRVGGSHSNAVGYATIDVINDCTSTLPTNGSYYTSEILFDNWLIGDYQQINPSPASGNDASGNPLVHIRAVPEGGPAGSVPAGVTNLPYTFYARYVQNTGGGTLNPQFRDRRQPLPATFAARVIQGGPGAFNTSYKIWREGRESVAAPSGYGPAATTATGSCSAVRANGVIPVFEAVRFDEHENPTTYTAGVGGISPSVPAVITLPATSATPTKSPAFPLISTSGDIGGWTYFNLQGDRVAGSSTLGPGPAPGRVNVLHPGFGAPASQNWVIVSMSAEGRYSVDFDAAWLGNGCTPPTGQSTANAFSGPPVFLGPAGLTPVCPASSVATGCSPGVAPYIGTNITP
jgi:hypothetical protein